MGAAVLGKDTVACCFSSDDADFCVAVWKGWGAKDFDIFYKSYEELSRLEACMRKRR